MDRQHVVDVVTKHIRLNAEDLDDKPIDTARSMKEFGLGSLDIVEIVSASMRELKIRVPRTELANLSNIDELVDLFLKVKQEQ
ncbi:phosphopantetheine-binding protein [Micromonospora sp. WMMD882]|uniref:phosphopantetheine-binding protein n=1 Tax=Micromonospora sp. WMMD882 TaxID=3015151 RepID=UPI00248CBD3E|nr:phosphopantetheine-binding protein [Micromonospora sp. WMMD882]WBB80646.1 phosphopantetheine-binding protein [Micromonospora sp. WMMD882]